MNEENFNVENIKNNVDQAMDSKTFNVLDYISEAPVATDTVTVYTDVANARKLSKLLSKREDILIKRKNPRNDDGTSDLSISDEDDWTEYDDEINGLVEELEKTALIFETQTVAPKLVDAMEKASVAKTDPSWSADEVARHKERSTAEILAKAIKRVTAVATGDVDESWDGDKVLQLEKSLYPEQAQHVIGSLYEIVYTGRVFDEALSVDF